MSPWHSFDQEEQDRQINLIEEIVQVGFWSRNAPDNFYSISPGVRRIFGLTFERSIIDRAKLLELCHPADRSLLFDTLSAPTVINQRTSVEVRIVRHDGEVRWVRLIAHTRFDVTGKIAGYYGIVQDITNERNVATELSQAQKMEGLGQLTSGIAHDFNNLLCVIKGNVELSKLIVQQAQPDNAALKFLDESLFAVSRGASLTSQLLAFGRKHYLNPAPIDAGRLLQRMMDFLGRIMGAIFRIELSLADGLWPIYADPDQLENALLNLVINARDALPAGGTIRISAVNATHVDVAETTIRAKLEREFVVLTVSDNGIGIPVEIQQKIFEPFFTTKEVGKGTGLGLSMVQGFAAQSGGRLLMQSALGVGTDMALWLPRAATHFAEDARPLQRETTKRAERITVLVVDDDPDVGAVAIGLLQDMGYYTLVAESAESALELARIHPQIDLVLTDLFLGGQSLGSQLIMSLRPILGTGVRYVVTSASPLLGKNELDQVPVNCVFMPKPFGQAELTKAIGEALENPQARFPTTERQDGV
jgi:PAS domain S-box-containing protein